MTNANIWTDPATGQIFDARTMEPLEAAGDNLGEKHRDTSGLAPIDVADPDAFARMLGISDTD